jgi:hypothetical protein
MYQEGFQFGVTHNINRLLLWYLQSLLRVKWFR